MDENKDERTEMRNKDISPPGHALDFQSAG